MGTARATTWAAALAGVLLTTVTGCVGNVDDAAGDRHPVTEGLGPPYPIVLAHGFFGTDQFIDVVDYWWQVQDALAADGETQVLVGDVDPFNDSTTRGHQLEAEIEQYLAQTGYAKVNIIAHSQGGLDARVVAAERPDIVASVVTLSTPHEGSPVADLALGLLDNPFGRQLVPALADLLGPAVYDRYDTNSDIFAALYQFSGQGIAEFNAAYPETPGVPFFSIAGRSDLTGAGVADCEAANPPAFITRWSHERDPIDPLLALFEDYLDGNPLGTWPSFIPNDGLVRAADARWGTFLGCLPADHLDEIGQLLGDRPGCTWLTGCNHFDHRQLFVDLVRWLRSQGL